MGRKVGLIPVLTTPLDRSNSRGILLAANSEARPYAGISDGMIGKTVSHYRIIGKLGVGGMGVVYEAEDTRLPRRVALKFLSQELVGDPEASRRLQREADIIARLNHPNICTIYEIDEHEGGRFIVMERVNGQNLKLHMARTTLSDQEIVDMARQVAMALQAAHEEGIVHRDIKPGNIMVGDDGVVKVLDFGLARRFMMPETGEVTMYGSTIPGRPLGTANYMAPERIAQGPLDPRSDLFSLGVVIYEMATGRLPFAGASPFETVTNIFDKKPTPLRELAPHRPAALARIVDRLLAKHLADRYTSADALVEALSVPRPGSRPPWKRLFNPSER
jgi:serine/threonine protein kinase